MQTPATASNFDALASTLSGADQTKLILIQGTLSVAVPGCIADLQRIGGPSDWHFGQAATFSSRLGAEGDTLLYRVKGKTAEMMARLCEVVAIMAFVPGGVSLMGLHFEAQVETTPDLDPLMQCACVNADARLCYTIRLNRDIEDLGDGDECQCYCHNEWNEDEEAEQP